MLLNAFKEFDDAADMAQTRRTVIIDTSGSESGGGGTGPRRRTKQRVNITQAAFKTDAERWTFVAGRFTEGAFQKPSAD